MRYLFRFYFHFRTRSNSGVHRPQEGQGQGQGRNGVMRAQSQTSVPGPPRLGVSRFTIFKILCHVGFSILQAV